jgi:hypothetical protein
LRIAPGEAVKRSGIAEVESLSLAKVAGHTYYHLRPAQRTGGHDVHHHGAHIPHGKATPGQVAVPAPPVFVSAVNGTVLPDGPSRFAVEIARSVVGGAAAGQVGTVAQFDAEYGFAFKRLPVQRVPFAGDVTVFVDPADGAIAAVIDNADRAEGWIFGYVHKLDWLVSYAGTDGRDAVAALLALLLATAALLGIALYLQQFRISKRNLRVPRQS